MIASELRHYFNSRTGKFRSNKDSCLVTSNQFSIVKDLKSRSGSTSKRRKTKSSEKPVELNVTKN